MGEAENRNELEALEPMFLDLRRLLQLASFSGDYAEGKKLMGADEWQALYKHVRDFNDLMCRCTDPLKKDEFDRVVVRALTQIRSAFEDRWLE